MFKFSLWTTCAVAAAYVAASEAALHWLRISGATPLIWLASGLGLAALLLRGIDALPGLWIGAFACVLLAGHSLPQAVALSLLTTLQIGTAWWLLRHAFGFDAGLERMRDVLLLIVVGAGLIASTSAAAGLVNLWWRPELYSDERYHLVQVAALGELIGTILLVPPILAWVKHARSGAIAIGSEAWLLYAVGIAVSLIVFSAELAPAMSAASLPYALFPVTFWAALRLGIRDTATVLILIGAIAVGYHAQGMGPFIMPNHSLDQSVAQFGSLYLFLVVLSVTSLLAAAGQRQREAAERQLRDSESRYRMLIERMNEGVNITDADARMTFVSDRFCDMTGYSRDELIGQTGAMLAVPEQRELWSESHRVRESGRSESHALTLRRKDGALVHVWISPSPQFDEGGRYIGSLNVVLDITDRRRAEDRAREHLDQLAHVARVASMGEMASAIAHEINQPLTAIANYANASLRLLKAGKLSYGDSLDTMQRLATEAERAGAVVRKMRGFVRGEEGNPVPVDVDELFADVLRLTSAEARQYEVDVVAESNAGLPQVLADTVQLQQVLLNLVRNASEAMAQARSAERRVTLSARLADPTSIEICVRDTGPGLSVAHAARVFEPFYTTKPEGLGIGLALCRSIVDAHGGRLWAEPGERGGVFRLTLPLAQEVQHAKP
jgi:PAS domain S-box-containing protein